jgi:uncharacterized SAM-binding protein YcdF (DUF218 family)
MIRRFRRWALRLTCLVLLAGLLLVWFAPGWVLPPLAHFLDVSQSPQPTDYVLVLNGDPETRPFAAAALVRAGLAREVLLTRQRLALESETVQEGVMLSELEITRQVLRHRGVPEESIRILSRGEITSTADEARELASFLATCPQATVTVVTNGFHTRRARMVFRRMLGQYAGQVFFVGVPREGINVDLWWQTSHGCGVYLTEYPKLAYYWLRH